MKTLAKTLTIAALASTLNLAANTQQNTPTKLAKPLIHYTSVEDAKGDVKAIYAEIKAAYGIVPEPIKGLSLNPLVLRHTWQMYKTLGSNKNFSPKTSTMMRYLIAEAHHCKFCVGFNKAMLFNIFKLKEEEITALQKDPSSAKLDTKQKTMLLFMLKSTSQPEKVTKADIDALKDLGWSEKDIMEGVKQATEMVATALFIDTFKIE